MPNRKPVDPQQATLIVLIYTQLAWLAVLAINHIPERIIRSRRLRPRAIDSFISAPDWATELRERQHVLLQVIELADRLGVRFAFPTRSIEVERLPGQAHPEVAIDTEQGGDRS